MNGEKRNANRFVVGKPERKRPLGRSRRMWVDNINMALGEIERGLLTGLITLGKGRGGDPCECDNEPSGSIKCWVVLV
jgi:hypothetical protein